MGKKNEYTARLADMQLEIDAAEAQIRSLKLEERLLLALQQEKRKKLRPLRRLPDDSCARFSCIPFLLKSRSAAWNHPCF